MKAFRAKEGRYVARLDKTEREVIGQLALDVAELLGATPVQLAQALTPHDNASGDTFDDPSGDTFDDPSESPSGDDRFGGDGTGGTGDDSSGDDSTGDDSPGDAAEGDPWDLPGLADPLAGLTLGGAGPRAGDPAEPGGSAEPDDPAVRRLLPTASDDADVAEEFRRLVQPDLRQLKIERLLALVRALRRGKKLSVPADRADLLSGALVDIRLVLAERLGIESDEAANALYRDLTLVSYGPDGEPVVGGRRGPAAALRLHLGSAYAALTWLQESLVTVQLQDLESRDA